MPISKDQTKHYKPSLVGHDTWTIMCPVDVYSFQREISVDDSRSRVCRSNLRLHCKIRFPDEIAGSFIEIAIWQSGESIVADDIDDDYVGVGVFHSLGREVPEDLMFMQSQSTQIGSFHLAIPVDADTLQGFGDMLVGTEGNPNLRREIHAEIAGLLNEWDGKGRCLSTKLSRPLVMLL